MKISEKRAQKVRLPSSTIERQEHEQVQECSQKVGPLSMETDRQAGRQADVEADRKTDSQTFLAFNWKAAKARVYI